MKNFAFTLFLAFISGFSFGQNRKEIDILKNKISSTTDDTNRVFLLADLGHVYRFSNPDSMIFYNNKAIELAQKNKFLRGELEGRINIAFALRERGDFPKSLDILFKVLKITEIHNFTRENGYCLMRIGHIFLDLNDNNRAIIYSKQAIKRFDELHLDRPRATAYMSIGQAYEQKNQLDSARYYEKKALIFKFENLLPNIFRQLGNIETKDGNTKLALSYYQKALLIALRNDEYRTLSLLYGNIAQLYRKINQFDSSKYNAQIGLKYGQKVVSRRGILLNANLLFELYDSIDSKRALYYHKMVSVTKDSLFGAGNIQAIQTMVTQNQERENEIESEKIAYQNRLKYISLLSVLGIMLVIGFILYRNNRQKQKANIVLENTLSKLRATQTQLIQKEKMASLGELTAGIAHEIQNPLNFVNNFSEVSAELIDELAEEQQKPDRDADLEAELLGDLKQNLQKINQHGQRASSIVKGMLEHSRTTTGERQPTELNALADEYLRLAYQGLRAKHKDFNCQIITDFAADLGKVEVVPQEIGRVLLNLFNNAFYAVSQRAKTAPANYQPTVTISTKQVDSGSDRRAVEIRVSDNGMGIPEAVKSKIFQPFFTTKPTGEGTGLGLSLSYDIITKGHGGTLDVESTEGEATTFVVRLSRIL